jgi:hypothetical protein
MRLATGALTALAAVAALAHAQPPPPTFAISLKPGLAVDGEAIDHVDVTLEMSSVEASAGEPLLQLPLVVSNVETVAAQVTGLSARDARGPLALRVEDEGSADGATRRWIAQRPVEGTVTISYRAPITGRSAMRGAAPPLELRNDAAAFSGAGSTFLLLPPTTAPHNLSVRWNLSGLPEGVAGVSSLGPGAAAPETPEPVARLARSFFMAGTIGRYPDSGYGGPFFAAWQDNPPFDARALMEWTARLHGRYVAFFGLDRAPPYGVFLRPNPVNAGGGVGLADSFVTTFGPDTDPEELKFTLSHEMFHTFAPSLSAPAGLESSWFGEGLAVFYARNLMLRFGQTSPEAFLNDLNFHAGRYYSSIMAEMPNSEVPRLFWADTRVRTLPYDRGSLYFAMVDDRMRKTSGGTRSLDDLMLAMAARQREGRALGNGDWEELLREYLGEEAVADFRAMLAGRMPLPDSAAFGPCFRRTTRPLRRYELGFEPAVLTEPRRIVRGLVPGSAAEQAGLRDGDEIVRPVPQDGIQGDQARLLRLEIRRDGRTFPLSYLPRGETVQAWQWERIGGVPDSACAL